MRMATAAALKQRCCTRRGRRGAVFWGAREASGAQNWCGDAVRERFLIAFLGSSQQVRLVVQLPPGHSGVSGSRVFAPLLPWRRQMGVAKSKEWVIATVPGDHRVNER